MLFKKINRNDLSFKTLKILFLRVIGVILLFGLTLFLTNNFEPDTVGRYDFLRTMIFVFSALILLGTEQSILYFAGTNSENTEALNVVYVKMISLILIAYAFLLVPFFFLNKEFINNYFNDNNSYSLIIKCIIILPFYAISILNFEMLRAVGKITIAEFYRNIVKYTPFLICAISIVILEKKELLINTYLFSFLVVALISSTHLYIQILSKKKSKFKNHNFTKKRIFLKSFPMALSGIGFFLLQSIDVFLIKKYINNEAVAFYSIAVKLVLILIMIVNAVNISLASKIAELYNKNNIEELQKNITKASKIMTLISFLTAIPLVFLSDYILLIFGYDYLVAKNSLILMIIAQSCSSIFGVSAVYLNMTKKQHYFQFILLSAVVINLILNVYLIPLYGIFGASISFSISVLYWNISSAVLIYIKDKIVLFPWTKNKLANHEN